MRRTITHIEADTEMTPIHRQGVKMDTVETLRCSSETHATMLFELAEKRLLDIDGWNELAGVKQKQYSLTDNNGRSKKGLAGEGDYICFDLPAPDSKIGRGQDWVQIVKVVHLNEPDFQSTGFLVRAKPNPRVSSTETAHFFKSETTNTFVVERHGTDVTAAVYGRNEVPNIKEAKGLYNKLRNTLIAVASWLGISKTQWKVLIKGFLKENDKDT